MCRKIWFVAVMVGLTLVGCKKSTPNADGSQSVSMALNWVPEPEFGGIYAAQADGTFAKHKLDVTILPGGAGAATWQLVAAGKATFAVASADEVLVARSRGADVVAIFAAYQTCPQGIMVHAARGLKTMDEVFAAGQLAIEPGLPCAIYLKNKYGFDKLKVIPFDGDIRPFLANKDLASQCFVTSEPIAAKRQGGDPQVFLIAAAGYNPYTAVVISSGQTVRQKPELVKAMAAALREGWRAYLDSPSAANAVMGKLNTTMDAATFAAAALAQKPLIETDETKAHGLGAMSRERWETLARQLAMLKVIDKTPPAQECFVPEP
ncbi:MAG: ABC transporter substrate-binding protein [Tepidisphaerales bacterium]